MQDDTEFAHRAKATRNRWALAKPFKSKGEAARDLRRHATIALGNDAFWPASVLVKVRLYASQVEAEQVAQVDTSWCGGRSETRHSCCQHVVKVTALHILAELPRGA